MFSYFQFVLSSGNLCYSNRVSGLSNNYSYRVSGLTNNYSNRVSGLYNNYSNRVSGLSNNYSNRVSGLSNNYSYRVSGLSNNYSNRVSGLSNNFRNAATKEHGQSTWYMNGLLPGRLRNCGSILGMGKGFRHSIKLLNRRWGLISLLFNEYCGLFPTGKSVKPRIFIYCLFLDWVEL
jgi:hypothetical protein